MKLFLILIMGLCFYQNGYSQISETTLSYFVPENAIIESKIDTNGFKTLTYWSDSVTMKSQYRFAIGMDVYNEKGQLILCERRFESIFYSINYLLNGIPSFINISIGDVATLIYYHNNGVVKYTGSYNISMSLDENNEIGSHCEYDETGQLMSFKLYDNGLLISEIHYK